ncbi:MAG TPA: undecaprenyl-diphosphate phosphatase [Paracoccaceae bacterium]|nr:undecaprenyl-diphosphate phosphatase [Paracoccaceae bacterium]HMO73004.1 undecaprenyl-diphosphate phosphatase [Paracoccaceae bacterium]
MPDTLVSALILGVIEGLTEFLPVSSTGHLLLAGHFMGFESAGRTFEVVIQLGAVLAIIWVYFNRLWAVARSVRTDPGSQWFVATVLLAFLPAAVIGVLAHGFIKAVLFETPALVAWMLIAGGMVLLVVDRAAPPPRYDNAMRLPLRTAVTIGFIQCLAMVPGVSRSGATIVGALMLGVSRRAAAEFSFFLSLPTMLGAFTYDLWKNRAVLDTGAWAEIAVGFAAAAVTGIFVVRWMLEWVTRNGFAIFGWWRIGVGSVALIALWLGR